MGFANLVADGFSMAASNFLGTKAEAEKAGGGGSIPSPAANTFQKLSDTQNACKVFSRVQYAYIGFEMASCIGSTFPA